MTSHATARFRWAPSGAGWRRPGTGCTASLRSPTMRCPMLDDSLHEQLADWVRPVTSLPIPDIRVLRRRARRRGMRRAVTAAAVVAAIAVGVTVSLPGTGRPAEGRPVASPAASQGIVIHGWRPAGPSPAADASPAVAPYIVIPGWGGDGTAQVRNIFAGRTIATIQ